MLNYCGEQPYNDWKIKNVLMVLLQCIILDCDVIPALQEVIKIYQTFAFDT